MSSACSYNKFLNAVKAAVERKANKFIGETVMATTSFKKEFIVNDIDAANKFISDVESGLTTISYAKKNIELDKRKVRRLLSRFALYDHTGVAAHTQTI